MTKEQAAFELSAIAETIERRMRAHVCPGFDCSTCGTMQIVADIKAIVDRLDGINE